MSAALKLHTEKNPTVWKVIRNSGNNNFEELDYYPFGCVLEGRDFSSEKYRYGFQNQERDDEMKGEGNSVNFTYRMLDTRLGRFLSADPIGVAFPYNSTYAFSENRVLDAIEYEGLEIILINPNLQPNIYLAGLDDMFDKSAIHVHAHGSPSGFQNLNDDYVKTDWVSSKYGFQQVLDKSNDYKNWDKTKELVVILHSCRGAEFAKKMSNEFNGTFVGATNRVWTSDAEEIGTYKQFDELSWWTKDLSTIFDPEARTTELGEWRVYTDGFLVQAFSGDFDPKGNNIKNDNFYSSLYEKTVTYTVKNAILNLRTSPEVINGEKDNKNGEALKRGDELTPTGNVKNGWIEVTTKDNRTGWVAGAYLNEPEVKD